VGPNNELQVITDENQQLGLTLLSSGEKQLLVLLTECLLQQKRPWVYIADAPELSLHVEWQCKLIDALLRVNPNSQVIMATHSPDIVGHYDTRAFDMEEILR